MIEKCNLYKKSIVSSHPWFAEIYIANINDDKIWQEQKVWVTGSMIQFSFLSRKENTYAASRRVITFFFFF